MAQNSSDKKMVSKQKDIQYTENNGVRNFFNDSIEQSIWEK